MKSVEEIQSMLVSELRNRLNSIKSFPLHLNYYNEILGDTSFLLAGLLGALLKNEANNWDHNRWIDDSLLTKVKVDGNVLSIWGVIIWGIENVSEQWTEPFYFQITLNKKAFSKYIFMFGDLHTHSIPYEEFKQNRDYWDKEFFMNSNWNPSERNWKYIIPIFQK